LVAPDRLFGPVQIVLNGATAATFFPLPQPSTNGSPTPPGTWSPAFKTIPISGSNPSTPGDDGGPGSVIISSPPNAGDVIPPAAQPPVYAQWVGSHDTLIYRPRTDDFVLTDVSGNQTTFYGFGPTLPDGQQGTFESYQPVGGSLISAYSHNAAGEVTEIRRSQTAGSVTTIESFFYSYYSSGELENLTLRRSTDNGNTWSVVQQVQYTYYQGTHVGDDAFGNLDDLKTAVVEDAHGNAISTTYYRYYVPDPPYVSDPGGLEYAFTPQAYSRLAANLPAGTTPLTADNGLVAPFATLYIQYQYPVYVPDFMTYGLTSIYQWPVAEEQVAGQGSNTDAGGLGTWNFYYYTSEQGSGFHGELNCQLYWTEVYQPDGNIEDIFCNFAGQTLIDIKSDPSGRQLAVTENQYDNFGFKTMTAFPSAVVSAVAGPSDDNDFATVVLSDHTGKIENFSTQAGYLTGESVQQGRLGTPVPLETIAYSGRTGGRCNNSQCFQRDRLRRRKCGGATHHRI
jgi:hypothetical protein